MKSNVGFTLSFSLLTAIFLIACHSNPPKTLEYFMAHKHEFKVEAIRCMNDLISDKKPLKDKTCMMIATLQQDRCRTLKPFGHLAPGLNCDDKELMIRLAEEWAR